MKNRIKILRAENDWSQARLAQELGVSRQTINAIETGKYDPGLPLAFNIAALFSRRIEEIFFPEAPVGKVPVSVVIEQAPDADQSPELDISLI
jgi:putative transcriptional regulator